MSVASGAGRVADEGATESDPPVDAVPHVRRRAARGAALALVVLGLATVSLNRIRAGGWAISDLVFLVAAAVVWFQLLTGRTRNLAPNAMRKTSPAILIGTLVVVIAATASSFQSFDAAASMTHVVRFAWVTLLWFWLLRAVCPDRRALARLLRGVAVTIYGSSVAALAGYLGIVQLTEFNLEGREAAFMNHYNELGGLLTAGLPLVVLGSFRLGRERASAYRRVAAIAVVVIAINTTGSLTAFIGCASGLAAAGALNVLTLNKAVLRRFRNPLPLLLGILVALFAAVWLSTSDLPALERFEQVGQEGTGPSKSADSRVDFIDEVVQNLDHYLVIGEGLATEVEVDGNATHRVHNLYFRLVYEAGIPALIGFGSIIVAAIRQSWLLAINTRGTELNRVVVGLFGSLVSMLVLAMFQPLLTQRYFWLPLALIGVVWALRRQELREAERVASPTAYSGPVASWNHAGKSGVAGRADAPRSRR